MYVAIEIAGSMNRRLTTHRAVENVRLGSVGYSHTASTVISPPHLQKHSRQNR